MKNAKNQLIFSMIKASKTLTDLDEVLSYMKSGEWIITELWKSNTVYYHIVKII